MSPGREGGKGIPERVEREGDSEREKKGGRGRGKEGERESTTSMAFAAGRQQTEPRATVWNLICLHHSRAQLTQVDVCQVGADPAPLSLLQGRPFCRLTWDINSNVLKWKTLKQWKQLCFILHGETFLAAVWIYSTVVTVTENENISFLQPILQIQIFLFKSTCFKKLWNCQGNGGAPCSHTV